jgi:uncharacterized membrane protein YhaH (DUF805 family)
MQVTFGEAISDGLSKYAQFSGRSSRSAYWWFVLFSILAYIATAIVDAAINTRILSWLAVLALFLPSLAVLVRRLHDTDRSGWWVFIWFVPIIGSIVLIVFACTDTGPPNKWGNGADGTTGMTVIPSLGEKFPPPPPPAPPGSPPADMPPPQESERAPD